MADTITFTELGLVGTGVPLKVGPKLFSMDQTLAIDSLRLHRNVEEIDLRTTPNTPISNPMSTVIYVIDADPIAPFGTTFRFPSFIDGGGNKPIRPGDLFIVVNITEETINCNYSDGTLAATVDTGMFLLCSVQSNIDAHGGSLSNYSLPQDFLDSVITTINNIKNIASGIPGLDSNARLLNSVLPYFNIVPKTAGFTVVAADKGKVFDITTVSSGVLTTVGANAATANMVGVYFTLRNSSLGVVRFSPTTDTVNGSATFELMPSQCATFVLRESSPGIYDWDVISAFWFQGLNKAVYDVTSSITIEEYHYGAFLRVNSASAITITVPQTSTAYLPEGFNFDIHNTNIGRVTLAKQGSDTISGSTIIDKDYFATVIKEVQGSPNAWAVNGGTSLDFSTTDNGSVFNALTGSLIPAFGNVGAQIIPANRLRAGTVIRIKAQGSYSTKATGAGNLSLQFKLNSSVPLDTNAFSILDNISFQNWEFNGLLTIRSTGVSGTINGKGIINYFTSASAMSSRPLDVVDGTIDTTIDQTMDLIASWSVADTGNAISSLNVFIEILN